MGNKLNLSSAVCAPLTVYQRSEGEAQQGFLPFCIRTEWCEWWVAEMWWWTITEHQYLIGPSLLLLFFFGHGHKERIEFKYTAAEHPLVMSLPSLLKANIYIWHILDCCHGNGCIDTSIAVQICSVQKDQEDDGWKRKRPALHILVFVISVLQLLSSKKEDIWLLD